MFQLRIIKFFFSLYCERIFEIQFIFLDKKEGSNYQQRIAILQSTIIELGTRNNIPRATLNPRKPRICAKAS